MSLFLLYRPRFESLNEIDGYVPFPIPPKPKAKELELRKELEQRLAQKVTELRQLDDLSSQLAKQAKCRIEWEIEELLFMVMFLDD